MKQNNSAFVILIAFTAAIGGFLLGFDGAVISGASPFYKTVFGLEEGSFLFGFSVSCLIWGCIFGNLFAGPLSDKIGRKPTLLIAALLFITSALISALAGGIEIFIAGRIIGGVAVGFAILVAPIYIAEVAPPQKRGWLVSFNQLLIVIGLSSAYFVNYFILKLVEDPQTNWRWMLGVEAIPAVMYFLLIMLIPESPRWLIMKNRADKARATMCKIGGREYAELEYENIVRSLTQKVPIGNMAQAKEFFGKNMRTVLIIGFGLAIFQQVSGINSILYYAPMIFETAGSGREAAFIQAIAIGVVFVVMTIVSMFLIDRVGRKPLLYLGVSIMALSLFITGVSFKNASYALSSTEIEKTANEILKADIWQEARIQNPNLISYSEIKVKDNFAEIINKDQSVFRIDFSGNNLESSLKDKQVFLKSLLPVADQSFSSELEFNAAIKRAVNGSLIVDPYLPLLVKEGIHINSMLVLISILGFIAGFSLSLGPVMWVMFSEIFPNRLRGVAISIVGTVNSLTSFVVTTLFPVQLNTFGSSNTFFIYAAFMFLCLLFVRRYVVETQGRSLEELEFQLVR